MSGQTGTPFDCDIAIIGGGIVGASLALALGSAKFDVLLLDAARQETPAATAFDGRAYSISTGCWRMFRVLGVAETLASEAEPIRRVEAESDVGRRLIIDGDDIGRNDEPLGYLVKANALHSALKAALSTTPRIRYRASSPVLGVEVKDGAARALIPGDDLKARLVVGCDGAASKVRRFAGIRTYGRTYGAAALTATVQLAKPHGGAARQTFLKTGPLAALPLPDNQANIIWSERANAAQALLQLPDDAFEAELRARVGEFIGAFKLVGHRFAYPLAMQIAEAFSADRIALAGDAAHLIHPLAGQGVNLGLKDVAALAETLADARRVGLDIGSAVALAPYDRWRRADTLAMAAVTESLARMFQGPKILRTVAGVGMGVVGRIPLVRKAMAAEAGGVAGDLPRLLAGEALV